MDVGFTLTHFVGNLLYLSALLVLVIFGNIPFEKGFLASNYKDIEFSTFSTCFVDFVSSIVF